MSFSLCCSKKKTAILLTCDYFCLFILKIRNYASIARFLATLKPTTVVVPEVQDELTAEDPSRPRTRRGTRESCGRWAGINSRFSNFEKAEKEEKEVPKPALPIEEEFNDNLEVEEIKEDEISLLTALRLAHLESRSRALSDEVSTVLTDKERRDIIQFRESDVAQYDAVVELARLLAGSKHAVAFTGAGISTGSGADLPTIRGKFGVSTTQLKEEDFDPTCVQVR
jgi:hypothetical protein